jgi:hypothetical protein
MLEEVAVTPLNPDRLRSVLTPDALAGFEHTLARVREMLSTRTLWNVNSTARGGGVAEMLRSLIGYARGGGSRARRPATPRASTSSCSNACSAPGQAGRAAPPHSPRAEARARVREGRAGAAAALGGATRSGRPARRREAA